MTTINPKQAIRRTLLPPVIALAALSGLLLWLIGTLLAAAQSVEQTDRLITQTVETLKLVVDAETGQRGYLVGGAPLFLKPYEDARARLPGQFDFLARKTADDPTMSARVSNMRRLYQQWEANAADEILQRQRVSQVVFTNRFNQATGKNLMDRLRHEFNDFLTEQTALRQQRTAGVQQAARRAIGFGGFAVLLVRGFIANASWRQIYSLTHEYDALLNAEQQARERFSTTLISIGDAVLVTDEHGLVTMMNPIAERMTGWNTAEAKGKNARTIFDIINEMTRLEVESPVDKVLREGVIVGLANHTILRRRDGSEVPIDDSGAPIHETSGKLSGVVLVFRDIHERREAERRLEFLADLTERTRTLLDPEAMVWEIIRSVGPFLKLSHCLYADIDTDKDTLIVPRDWRRDDSLPSLAGEWPLTPWYGLQGELRQGHAIIVNDLQTDPRTAASYEPLYAKRGLRASVLIPVIQESRWVGVLSSYSSTPRDWTPAEINLLEAIAERIWLAVENARLFRKAKEDEERFRALVEASSQMLWRTGADGRVTDMPSWREYTGQSEEQVQGLGWIDALQPDDQEGVRETWLRAYPSQTLYECECQIRGKDGIYRWFSGRGVPLLQQNGSLREYIGAWSNIDARKRAEEDRQIRAVKNERIAETLQNAMLLAPPENAFAGLSIGSHYEAARDEALIGGDFFDTFALDAECVALIVGDCTGKGLEAARYVSEAQFMLRAFLRENPDPGVALGRLNQIIVDGQQLDHRSEGALTCVAVAVINSRTGETWVAAGGAEPPLVVRADTGNAEEVEASGTVLGIQAPAHYEVAQVTLRSRDLIVMTTDGITEARNRKTRAFFGYGGLIQAVQNATLNPGTSLTEAARSVVDQAKMFANGALGDDVCLLLTRLEPGDSPILETE